MSHHNDKNANKLPLPPRWLRCPRRGQLIANKFIPFKTPLDSKYDDQISEVYRFPPSMFLDCMHSQKIKVGFWIDLTNTSRFYDRLEVEKAGVGYVKLQCKGHGECPSKDQTKLFINLCDNFIKSHPLEVIGLHCTHGFNRTGFLICAFLVERFSWSIDAAVQVFSSSRSPGIYKSDYITELFTRYGDSTYAVPPPPPLPDWCMDEDDSLDDDGNPVQVNGKDDSSHSFDEEPRRRREFFKKNATFMEGITGIEPITKQPLLAQIQRQCQDMCGWESSGFPGSQPVSMDKDNIKLVSQKPYKVSWKADGTRYMMLIDGEDEVYMIDRDNAVFKVPYLKFPRRKDLNSNITKTLLDGEMIIDKVHGQSIPRYLIYDIIKFEGQDVGGTDFGRRLYCIRKEIIDPRHILMQQGKIDRAKEPFSVRNKNFWDTPVVPNLLGEKFAQTVSHEIDGLIFQPKKNPYMCGRSPEVLKWKPPSLNSVDFKLVIQKISGQLGMLPETRGNLFVGGFKNPFSCIKVTKDLKQYDGKIIECTYDGKVWKFLRERTDKSFPNSYDTAMGVCNSILVPITKELLLEHINKKRIPQDRDLMPPPAKIPKVSNSQ